MQIVGCRQQIWVSARRKGLCDLEFAICNLQLHGQGGTGGPLGVVLVGDRRAEDGQQLVALVGQVELIHKAAVLLHRRLHGLEEGVHRGGGPIGRQVLDEVAEAEHLGEEHRDRAQVGLDHRALRVGQDALNQARWQVGADPVELAGEVGERGDVEASERLVGRGRGDRRCAPQVAHANIALGHLLAQGLGGDGGPGLGAEHKLAATAVALGHGHAVDGVAHGAVAQGARLAGADQGHPAALHADVHAQGEGAHARHVALEVAQLAQQAEGGGGGGAGMLGALEEHQQGVAAEGDQVAAGPLDDLDHRAEVAVERVGDNLGALAPEGREALGQSRGAAHVGEEQGALDPLQPGLGAHTGELALEQAERQVGAEGVARAGQLGRGGEAVVVTRRAIEQAAGQLGAEVAVQGGVAR